MFAVLFALLQNHILDLISFLFPSTSASKSLREAQLFATNSPITFPLSILVTIKGL